MVKQGNAEPWDPLGYVARESESAEALVRRYANLGLIESRRDRNNRRTFPPGTAAKVKAIKAQRTQGHRAG